MRPADLVASLPGASWHLGGSPSPWLRWSSCTPFRVRERQDRETLGRGGDFAVEAHDRIADQARLCDMVPVVLTHFLFVDVQRHGARDGAVSAHGTETPGELGTRVCAHMVHELGVARHLGVVSPGARLAPRGPVDR